jgi:hypothetical protein
MSENDIEMLNVGNNGKNAGGQKSEDTSQKSEDLLRANNMQGSSDP